MNTEAVNNERGKGNFKMPAKDDHEAPSVQ
jgi:hypothetical protein